MILRIVAPLVASVGAAATLKSKICVSAPWLPHFPWPLADAISGIDCIWQDGKLDLSPG